MMLRTIVFAIGACTTVAQQVGTNQAENHPPLTTYECSSGGSCAPDASTSLTLDANWRWTHKVGSSTNCYTGDEWDTGICPDPVTCAANCALDGADYPGIYGVRATGDSVSFKLVTVGASARQKSLLSARVFTLASLA